MMESFRYIHLPVLLNASSRDAFWKMSNRLLDPTLKMDPIVMYRPLMMRTRGAGVEISLDHRREIHKDYGETELDCRL